MVSETTAHPVNFVASLGHDLRSHLTAIIGFARLIQRRAQLEPKQQDNLERILTAADQQLNLINTVVDLAKAESGTLELQAEPVDLPALLTSVSDSMRRRIEEKGLRLKTHWPSPTTLVELDERRLYQVLTHLLGNAIRYTEQGEVMLHVEQDHDVFRFSVHDTGCGIDAEYLEQLLQTPPPVPAARGSGLGVPLSRVLIELMGGKLEASSRVDEGSCFQFELQLPAVATTGMYQSTSDISEQTSTAPSYSKVLPVEMINTLTDLALQGDIKGILDQAESLHEYSGGKFTALATELIGLAKSFQVNKICELLTTMKSQA